MKAASAVCVERIEYAGWQNCYRLSNGSVELVVTGDVGPRILRYGFSGGQNLLKEFTEQLGKSGESEFRARGGHRLWKAPEDLATTWIADNHAVAIRAHASGITAIAPIESASGLQKEIAINLADSGSGVTLTHRIINRSRQSLTFAPWALTVMAPGGVALAAFPARAEYPGSLQPTNPLVMWAYTDFSDPRWTLMRKYLMLRQDQSSRAPQKTGMFNENAWAAYLLQGDLFGKRAQSDATKPYPDFGCSLELFTNHEFLELETLGPLCSIAPGKAVEHVEKWSLHRGLGISELTEDVIDSIILPLVERETSC